VIEDGEGVLEQEASFCIELGDEPWLREAGDDASSQLLEGELAGCVAAIVGEHPLTYARGVPAR
jgi:hypothetical protein